jgi:hypothetical protein
LSFLRPCPVDSIRTRAASLAGTSTASIPRPPTEWPTARPVAGALDRPHHRRPALGEPAQLPVALGSLLHVIVASGARAALTAAAVHDALCGSIAMTTG